MDYLMNERRAYAALAVACFAGGDSLRRHVKSISSPLNMWCRPHSQGGATTRLRCVHCVVCLQKSGNYRKVRGLLPFQLFHVNPMSYFTLFVFNYIAYRSDE